MQSNKDISPIYLQGAVQKPTTPISLQAGPLSMLFDPESANLRSIYFLAPDGHRLEVLRGIYAAVRDHNWGTLEPHVSDLRVETSSESFSLQFQMLCSSSLGSFLWKGQLTGEASGKVCFEMAGQALSTFRRNRIGFCVLHPSELAGRRCTVEHNHETTTDHLQQESAFPQFISAQQPMNNLRSITHQVVPGVDAKIRMEGETFEMEDQRNWVDASFKTYCTPLSQPYPVEITTGEKVCQTVTLTLQGIDKRTIPATTAIPKEPPMRRLTLHPNQTTPIPQIGLGMSSSVQNLSPQELKRLAALNLSHLRVDLQLAENSWRKEYDLAVLTAKAIAAELEVAIFLSNHAKSELMQLQTHLAGELAPIAAWLIFHVEESTTSSKWMRFAKEMLEPISEQTSGNSDVQFVAGTNMNFAELNRDRPPVDSIDGVCFSINPQVHAFDNISLVETLPMQAAVVESTRQFCGNLPIRITPVTLRPRFNAVATGPSSMPEKGELPSQVDPRQLSLFGAAWTLGSLKVLTASGVHSITYYETVGWRGVQESEQGSTSASDLHKQFPSFPASVFPLYHVLADIGEFSGGDAFACKSSSPNEFEGIALGCQGRRRLILASFTDQEQVVLVNLSENQTSTDRNRSSAKLRQLDQHSLVEAVRTPELFRSRSAEKITPNAFGDLEVKIPPHSILRIDY